MNNILTVCIVLLAHHLVLAQSKATEALIKQYPESFSLFFYQNTLRMINQEENKEFDELIKEIEKMKFLMIDKQKNFGTGDYRKIKAAYESDSFEEVMSSRHQGVNFDVMIKEKNGKTQGMIILVNDSSSLFILDVVGRIALDKVPRLYQTIDESTDVGKRIKNFATRNDKRKEGDKEEKPDH